MCSNLSDATCFTDYDSVANVFIVYASTSRLGILIYDPVKDKWQEPIPRGDKLSRKGWGARYCGYFDTERNVTVFHNPNTGTFVYRCKSKKAEK